MIFRIPFREIRVARDRALGRLVHAADPGTDVRSEGVTNDQPGGFSRSGSRPDGAGHASSWGQAVRDRARAPIVSHL